MDNHSLTAEQLAAVRAVVETLNRRDRALWIVSYHCAYRISETLSVRVGDVWNNGVVRQYLRVESRHMKGGGGAGRSRRRVRSRTVPIHPVAAGAIRDLLEERMRTAPLHPDAPLFESRQSKGPIAMTQAWRIFRRIYARIGITDAGYATHVTRRTAARNLYSASHDPELVRAALGHKSLLTTQIYIRASEAEAAAALLKL